MSEPNFNLVSELIPLIRRDMPADDPTILAPLSANPLVDGEWVELNSTGTKLKRGSTNGIVAAYPVHTERGRYDTQSLGKINVLQLGQYEAETKVVDISSLAVGDALMVGDVTNWLGSGLTKRGLLKSTGGAGVIEVGYVTKLFGSEVKVRFIHNMNIKHA